MPKEFISYDAYKKLAKKYAEIINFKPHNAEYERPGLLKLIPNVKGKKVLDAGCGTGSLTEWLVNNGADVTGVDASPHMLAQVNDDIKSRARLVEHNLETPLLFLEDNSMDLVTASLVIHYIKNIEGLFNEFSRVLKPNGHLIFSIIHPVTDFIDNPSSNYYDTKLITHKFGGFTEDPVAVPCFRRPLQEYTETLYSTGFCIERLTEPQPSEKFKHELPESYEKHLFHPLFIVIKARLNFKTR